MSLSLGLACHALAEEVEVKLVVNEARIADALRKFTNDKRGEERNIYFLETDDMELSRRGIILRLRETPGKRDESTVKLRGEEAALLPDAEFPVIDSNGEESKAEKDRVIGGREARSFSITAKQREGEVVGSAQRPTRAQRASLKTAGEVPEASTRRGLTGVTRDCSGR